jgi:hypothetical protein
MGLLCIAVLAWCMDGCLIPWSLVVHVQQGPGRSSSRTLPAFETSIGHCNDCDNPEH